MKNYSAVIERCPQTKLFVGFVKLAIPGNDLLASARGKTFEHATTKVVEALKKQIKNLKT